MLISSLNRDMAEKRCLVKIGGDRLENLLPVNEYNALNENKSILVSNLPKKRIFRPSPERATPPPSSTTTLGSCSDQQQQQQQQQQHQQHNQDIKTREESDDEDDVVAKTTSTSLRPSSTETAQVVVSCGSVDKSADNNNGNDDNNVVVADTRKMKHRVAMSGDGVDEKVTPDERRVAPIIIRASKIASSSSSDVTVGSGIQVEKIEVIRLPAKLSKIRAKSPTSNDASSASPSASASASPSASTDAEQQQPRIKTIKIKSKHIENSVDSQNGSKLKKKKREIFNNYH